MQRLLSYCCCKPVGHLGNWGCLWHCWWHQVSDRWAKKTGDCCGATGARQCSGSGCCAEGPWMCSSLTCKTGVFVVRGGSRKAEPLHVSADLHGLLSSESAVEGTYVRNGAYGTLLVHCT